MKGGYNYINKGKGKGKGKSKTFKAKRAIGGKKNSRGGSYSELKKSCFLPYNTNVSTFPKSTTLGGKTMKRRNTVKRINKKLIKGGNVGNIIGDFSDLPSGGSLTAFGNTLGNQTMSNILGSTYTETGNVSIQPNLLM